MTVATAYSGNVYSIVGTVSEIRAELNRKNVSFSKILFGGNDSGVITLFIGSI